MITQAQRRHIRSLATLKGRREANSFVAEGPRMVAELMPLLKCRLLVATYAWLENNPTPARCEVIAVSPREMEMVSTMKNPQEVLAVFEIPTRNLDANSLGQRLTLALDTVQDPGNLGTIIRVADWFGITDVICSHGCADAFSPKVIQSTMGAIGRVGVHYVDLPLFLDELDNDVEIYGTFLDGNDIFTSGLTPAGIIVMGNEGRGISTEVERRVTSRLRIPSFPVGATTVESLNVGVATAITVAEFRRRSLT